MIFTAQASCVVPLDTGCSYLKYHQCCCAITCSDTPSIRHLHRVPVWGEVLRFGALLFFEQKTRVRPEEERNLQAGGTIGLPGLAACPHPWQEQLDLVEGEGNFVMPSLK